MPKKVTGRGKTAPPAQPTEVESFDSVRAAAERLESDQARFLKNFKPKAGTKYIRNIRDIMTRLTLDTGRRIELAPRGQIDDLAPVTKEEQSDAKFLMNFGLIFEILEPKQAAEVIRKQAINAQAPRSNPLFDHLLNERGEPYAQQDVQVQPSVEQLGITVAQVEDTSNTPHTERNTDLRRATAPEQPPVPGSVQNPLPEIPSDIPAELVHEFLAWKQAQG